MPYETISGSHLPIQTWAPILEIEPDARKQLERMAALPWVVHHLAVMPDVHLGKGATVGSVVAMRDAVAPAAVGVDIGCGMAAIETNLRAQDLPDDLRAVRAEIERTIPVGMSSHDEPVWDGAAPEIAGAACILMKRYRDLARAVSGLADRAACQLGTLGGGNHFIEICLDSGGRVWLMLHSGSRHIGNALAEHHMQIARKLGHNEALEDRDLAVFLAGTPEFAAYRRDLFWAQEYARCNREVMLDLLSGVVRRFWPAVRFLRQISCHHNYVAEERHYGEDLLVTRKGAIRAGAGDLGIIPGSMGTRSYIVRGKGNEASFCSASHGAGRRMSRTQARKRFSLADLKAQTAGVECRKDAGVLDEAPGAYKDIDAVITAESDLVEVVAELKQILCVKG